MYRFIVLEREPLKVYHNASPVVDLRGEGRTMPFCGKKWGLENQLLKSGTPFYLEPYPDVFSGKVFVEGEKPLNQGENKQSTNSTSTCCQVWIRNREEGDCFYYCNPATCTYLTPLSLTLSRSSLISSPLGLLACFVFVFICLFIYDYYLVLPLDHVCS